MEIVKIREGISGDGVYRNSTRFEKFLDRVEKYGFHEAMARFYIGQYIGLWVCGVTAVAVFATWFASL